MNHLLLILFVILTISCSNQNKDQTATNTLKKNEEINSNASTKKNGSILISDISSNNLDILTKLIAEKLTGKVVYVDIWATWCRPCLAEIPYSKVLESKFAGKNISFITLCCSSKQEVWEKTVSDYEIPGEHHLLNENQCMSLRDTYHLVAFPSYLIFNKSGTLIYPDAPRPSSNEIEGMLNELVEK
jgi:thiol-disulfide isomerase/thioredoxin